MHGRVSPGDYSAHKVRRVCGWRWLTVGLARLTKTRYQF
jgi:hypothetical protein